MQTLLPLLQMLTAGTLIAVILLQAKGTGLSSTFGGAGMFYQSRRGIEKIFFRLTVALAVIVGILSVLNIWLAP
ncbi:MAG: preprotein translocase subunit SecG [bacterium]|nr:preprotein translocase subunit SecG [bacterium]